MLIFIYFTIYSFIGYICEVIFCSFGQRRLVNRGFLYLPICPIYGLGAVLIIFFQTYINNILILFLLSIVFTTIIEYLTSYIIEKVLKIKLWDYSDKKYNINGRVCLKNSILFGLMGIVLVFIHPYIIDFINVIDKDIIYYLGVILIIVLVIDFIFSIIKYVNIFRMLNLMYYYIDDRLEIIDDKKALAIDFFESSKFSRIMRKLVYSYPNIKKKNVNIKDIFNKYFMD